MTCNSEEDNTIKTFLGMSKGKDLFRIKKVEECRFSVSRIIQSSLKRSLNSLGLQMILAKTRTQDHHKILTMAETSADLRKKKVFKIAGAGYLKKKKRSKVCFKGPTQTKLAATTDEKISFNSSKMNYQMLLQMEMTQTKKIQKSSPIT